MSAIYPKFPPFPPLKACGLCGGSGELQESHLIPRFVAQSLRALAGTAHIRDNHTPNRRIQDAEKVRLLCEECEQRFGAWEGKFAEKIYWPLLGDPTATADFGGWMSRFGVSLTWRVLRRYQLLNLLPEPREAFQTAEFVWREFLLGMRRNVGQHEIHLFPMEAPLTVPGDGTVRGLDPVPVNWSRYSLTTMGYDLPVAGKSHSALVYVKIPRYAFFGIVAGKSPLIRGTKLPMGKGRLGDRDNTVDTRIMNYMFEKAREADQLIKGLSDSQKVKIQDAMRSDPDRMRASESFRAIQADARLFGSRAFRKSDPSGRS